MALSGTLLFLGREAALVVLLLCILEITFSFENAVINARVLSKLNHYWQTIFLSVGIIIAVFGMRILFPILLVSASSSLGFGAVVNLAFNDPQQYSQHLEDAGPIIAAFGGSFLLMVALGYFMRENKRPYWWPLPEQWLRNVTKSLVAVSLIGLAIATGTISLIGQANTSQLLIASMLGVGTFSAIHGFVFILERLRKRQIDSTMAQHGMTAFVSFIYLEILDASFSLDGVIGAFAITSSVILIAIGLGTGAIWVRSMTISLVRHQTLARFAHLEQGAHYAILVLALVLLFSISVHIPSVITGLVGVIIVGLSLFSSERRESKAEQLA